MSADEVPRADDHTVGTDQPVRSSESGIPSLDRYTTRDDDRVLNLTPSNEDTTVDCRKEHVTRFAENGDHPLGRVRQKYGHASLALPSPKEAN